MHTIYWYEICLLVVIIVDVHVVRLTLILFLSTCELAGSLLFLIARTTADKMSISFSFISTYDRELLSTPKTLDMTYFTIGSVSFFKGAKSFISTFPDHITAQDFFLLVIDRGDMQCYCSKDALLYRMPAALGRCLLPWKGMCT